MSVTHLCPPTSGFVTPCCAKSPFDLPLMTDRITLVPKLVTCEGMVAREDLRLAELTECFRICPWCDEGPVSV